MNLTELVENTLKTIREYQYGDQNVNAFVPHTDKQGITHIHVTDLGKEYELVDGEWVEMSPF